MVLCNLGPAFFSLQLGQCIHLALTYLSSLFNTPRAHGILTTVDSFFSQISHELSSFPAFARAVPFAWSPLLSLPGLATQGGFEALCFL